MNIQELEEIIRQAYFIGVRDAEQKHPSIKMKFRQQRIK